ncbi:MAG: class I SAM-dependent methyltransferase, partial [Fimbriimonadaceae bacterium]
MEQVHFDGSVPEAYLKYLQPLLFDPFSAPFASRVCAFSPGRVLELACGTGALTGELATRCLGEIVVTDLQAAMVEVAKREFWHASG